MTKQEFKQMHRNQRVTANGGMGVRIAKIVSGEVVPSFDNKRIWNLRDTIAAEVYPIIRLRQLAWITG